MDVLSLAVGVAMASVIPVLILTMQARSVPMYRGPSWWTIGFALIAASRVMSIARSQPHLDGPASFLTVLLLCAGFILLVEGLARFQDRRCAPRLEIAVLTGVIVLATAFTLLADVLWADQVLTSAIWAAGALASAWFLTTSAAALYRPAARLLVVTLVGMAAFHLLRIPFALGRQLPSDSPFAPSAWTFANQAVTLIGLLIIGFGLVLMAGQRLSSDLQGTSVRLADLNANLEARVATRTAQLVAANHQLSEFTASISHDLKAPLRAINGFASLLVRDERDRLSVRGRDRLDAIVGSTTRMARLIEELLDYARLGGGPVRAVPVPLAPVLAGIRDRQAQRILDSGAMLTVDEPLATPLADPELVARILDELVDNALTFVRPGTAPVVTIQAFEESGRVRIAVADEGIGVAPEHRLRIFDVFTTLNPAEAYPGNGIGLAIVRKAAQLMGGAVWLATSEVGGSRFWIELPAYHTARTN
ncbi:MAG: HAMP domain-containing sensor histidine kinase [Chloroflexota bacterium]